MRSQTGTTRDLCRRLVAGGAVAASLVTGLATPSAWAQPAGPTETEAPAPTAQADGPTVPCTGQECHTNDQKAPKVSADAVLSQIYDEYRQGDGGGQISTLIDDAMKLRKQGFRPSNANAEALAAALDERPNQTPLVEALKDTLAYQRKLQARAQRAVTANGPIAGPVPVMPGMTMPAG